MSVMLDAKFDKKLSDAEGAEKASHIGLPLKKVIQAYRDAASSALIESNHKGYKKCINKILELDPKLVTLDENERTLLATQIKTQEMSKKIDKLEGSLIEIERIVAQLLEKS